MTEQDIDLISTDTYQLLKRKINQLILLEKEQERKDNPVLAVSYGFRVWELILELKAFTGAQSIYELERRGFGQYVFSEWSGFFETDLHNACLRDKSLYPKKVDFLEQYISMHDGIPGVAFMNLENLRIAFAECFFKKGDRKTGDAWFQKWLDEESDWSSGWCAWADCYWLWKSYPVETDYEKAKMLYQKGLFSGNAEDRAFILERMKHLAQDQKMNNEALPDD